MGFINLIDKMFYFLDEGFIGRISGDDGIPPLLFGAGLVFIIFFSYLIGSVNFAILISGKKYKDDIRAHGSKNAGTTNMMRTFGKKAAAFTLAGDLLKAVVACLIGRIFFGGMGCYVAGLFCIVGHVLPVFHRFKGGKGVATVAGVILIGNPIVFLIMLTIFIIIAASTKYISLASVMGMIIYPIILHKIESWARGGAGFAYTWIAVIYAGIIVFMHRENITRLLNGKENKFSFKKSDKK